MCLPASYLRTHSLVLSQMRVIQTKSWFFAYPRKAQIR